MLHSFLSALKGESRQKIIKIIWANFSYFCIYVWFVSSSAMIHLIESSSYDRCPDWLRLFVFFFCITLGVAFTVSFFKFFSFCLLNKKMLCKNFSKVNIQLCFEYFKCEWFNSQENLLWSFFLPDDCFWYDRWCIFIE